MEALESVRREGRVLAVHRSTGHTMAKPSHESITLLAGLGIVVAGGEVRAGDVVRAELPAEPYRPLERV